MLILKLQKMHSILQNPTKPIPLNNVDTATILKMIQEKNLNPNYQLIQKLREFTKADPEYRAIKRHLQCFTPNASFTDYVNRNNVSASSGYVYIDLDSDDNFEFDRELKCLMKNPHTYAIWTSVGGRGIGCLLRVDWIGISDLTFKIAFKEAETTLSQYGSTVEYIDPNCKNISRLNFISHSTVWINENAISIPKPRREEVESLPTYTYAVSKKEVIPTTDAKSSPSKLHYSTQITDWGHDEKYRFVPEGIPFVSIYIGKSKFSIGERTNKLFNICCKLAVINPGATQQTLYQHLFSVNRRFCVSPKTPQDILKIVSSVLQYRDSGTLYARSVLKYVWFNPAYPLSAKKKQSIAGELLRSKQKDLTFFLLEQTISTLKASSVKITQKSVSDSSGKSVRTVRRYWNALKEFIF